MDWANGSLSPAHRPVLMGLVRTPADKRDPASIAAGIAACEALLAILDDELATSPAIRRGLWPWRHRAVAPFVYNLMTIVDNWQPRRTCSVGTSQQLNQRQAWRDVVMIPVT